MRVIKYTQKEKKIWDDFIDSSKNGTFMFKRDYMDYHSSRFKDCSLMFYEDEQLVAIMPASIHGNELRSHGGLTYGGIISGHNMKAHNMLEVFDSLKLFLKENDLKKIIYKKIPYIYQNYLSDEDLYALFKNNAKLIRRDISTTIDLACPCKMTKGRKAQISRAKREGVVIKQSDDFETFIELENQVLKEKHGAVAVHSAEELKLLYSRFPNEIKLYVAQYQKEIIAGALIFIHKNLIHTQYLASGEKSREIGALDLLIGELLQIYKDKKYFDFGISTTNAGKDLNEGLISQKEGFGGRATVYDFYELEIE